MKILDKLYLNVYWFIELRNNSNNSDKLVDESMRKSFQLSIFGLLMIIDWLVFFNKSWDEGISDSDTGIIVILLTTGTITFWIVETIFKRYYTDERKKIILKTYPQPGKIRILIFVSMILGSLALLISGLLTGLIMGD
jgi:hypothetical protein